MIERYENAELALIWSDKRKLQFWQGTEFAVIEAREKLGIYPSGVYQRVQEILEPIPIDIEWWKARDREIKHDLNAFLDERRRFLPIELHQYWHDRLTSYDTEETPFMQRLQESCGVLLCYVSAVDETLTNLALQYRYMVMVGRTHGQEAELRSFGSRCLTWRQPFRLSAAEFFEARSKLEYSKISGAIGNYSDGIDPRVEENALKILGFKPFYGATQILPRELHFPLASALLQIALSLEKMAEDIYLGARSGRPLYHEPFGKKQKGSSAMPHKKNTIVSENIKGMARMARGFFDMIRENIVTREDRSIEQSSVERVAWPDLFDVVTFALDRMNFLLKGLVVYPDHMMQEIVELHGCYASSEAKEFIKKYGMKYGIDGEVAYRIVQLASFNVVEPSEEMRAIREVRNKSLEEVDALLEKYEAEYAQRESCNSIRDLIAEARLSHTDALDIPPEVIEKWNNALASLFGKSRSGAYGAWCNLFLASHALENEEKIFEELL